MKKNAHYSNVKTHSLGSLVISDAITLGIYSTDASMYQMQPLAIAKPLNRDKALELIRFCAEKKLPLLARGGGTSLTGQSIGEAVILDLSKHMNKVLELNLEEGWVRVEPGIVCSNLNAFLKPYGVHFAPDPATENRANIGGMIANNSAGMRSVCYGMTIDHVLGVDLALSSGQVLNFSALNESQWSAKMIQKDNEGNIYRCVRHLIRKNKAEILNRYPRVIRRSGGYALDALIDESSCNLAKLICGSEGTLGIVLEAKLKLTPLPRFSAVCLAHFDTLDASLRASASIVAQGPSAVELIDGVILGQAKIHPLTREVCSLLEGDPKAILIIEVQGDNLDETLAHIQRISDRLLGVAYALPIMTEAKAIQSVWQLRSSSLGLMTTLEGRKKPVPYIEDAAVPPENLADYVAEVLAICDKYEQPVSLFGHASVGLMHIRPLHDLHQPADIARMKKIQEEVFPLVQKYGGSWSGEHGDGIVRGGFNKRFFGEQLYNSFVEVKNLFDPDGRMNPGKIIETPAVDSHLRFGSYAKPENISSMFHFRKQGGMLAASEQCTGVGSCRKTLSGVMCPSYMATLDEVHSTRGRANALRLAMTGQLGEGGVTSESLKSTMDLCLSCKGCKGECPNSVDMAQLKSEVLFQYQNIHGISFRSWFFANQSSLAKLLSGWTAPLSNFLLNLNSARWILKKAFGITSDRPLPLIAKQRLSDWFSGRVLIKANRPYHGKVVFFNDTYTEHYLPQVGRAAIEVLEAAGYQVELATLGDSQRSAISQGLLAQAKRNGTKLFNHLDSNAFSDLPILVCEPSCASALKDDLPDLLDDVALGQRVAKRVQMFDHFLEQAISSGDCSLALDIKRESIQEAQEYLVHGHCHQKTLDGGRWTHRLLARIPGAVVNDTDAGCCGMAGSFGYEIEHEAISRSIAEQRLLPKLTQATIKTQVVSNGFSCRHQIADLSGRRPMHIAEVLREFL